MVGSLSLSAFADLYRIRRKETLSQIVHRFLPGRVYGKKGNLKKILALNPQIRDPDRIFPGQTVELGIPLPAPPATTQTAPHAAPPSATYDDLTLTPFFAKTTLSASDLRTGAQTRLNSASHYGLEADYIFHRWNDDAGAFVRFKGAFITFEPPTQLGKTLVESSKFLSTFGLGAKAALSKKLRVSAAIQYEKMLFSRAVSTSSSTVDAVDVPAIQAAMDWAMIQSPSFTLGLACGLEFLFPSSTDSYSVGHGESVNGILYYRGRGPHGSNAPYQIELSENARFQNTSLVTQRENNLSLQIRFFLKGGN